MRTERALEILRDIGKALVLFIIALGSCSAAGLVPDNWSPEDTQRQLAYTTIAIMDAGTTADIRNHAHLEEVAPVTRQVLGRNPEPGETAAYFAGMAVLNYAVSAALPPKYRKIWQLTTITVNGSVVANNYRIGLTWGF